MGRLYHIRIYCLLTLALLPVIAGAQSVRVPGFTPSIDGFHFGNGWPPVPVVRIQTPVGELGIDKASDGLCLGMVYAVRDFFEAQVPGPPLTSNPGEDTALFSFIGQRLYESFRARDLLPNILK